MAHLKSSHSPQRQRLIRELQRINFGRIDGLTIRDGEPVFDPMPKRQIEFKFGSDNGPRAESNTEDFSLKRKIVELFEFFDHQKNCVIDALEIQHGLPFRMIVTEVSA